MDDVYPAPHEAWGPGPSGRQDAWVRCLLVHCRGQAVHQCQGGQGHRACSHQSNTWMDQVQKDRAFWAWASEKKVRMDSIKLEDIRGSPLGLKGWAAKYDEMSAASSPAPNTKAPKKSSKGGGKGKGGSTRNKAASTQAEEKKARELLASVSHTQHIMRMICKQAKEDENEQWLWAKPFLLEYQECLNKDFETNSGEFLTRLKLAIHIPAELRLMKKAGPNCI